MKKIIVLLVVSVVLLSCTQKTDIKTDCQPIHVNVEGPFQKSLLDIVDIIEIIKLENNENSAIGHVQRILYEGGKFFILDTKSKKVLVFRKDGKYLKNIGRAGRGPKEFADPSDISISNDKKYIAVLDGDMGRAILYYDLEGTFIKKIKLPTYFSSLHMVSEDRFILLKINSIFKGQNYNIYIVDGKGKIISMHCPFDKQLTELNHTSFNSLYHYKEITNIALPRGNTVLKVNNDIVFKDFCIDYSHGKLDKEQMIELYNNCNRNAGSFMKKLNQIDKVSGITMFVRNGNCLYFAYRKKNITYSAYKKIDTDSILLYNHNNLNDIYHYTGPMAHLGDYQFINVMFPYSLKGKSDLSFRLRYLKMNYPQEYDRYMQELSDISLNDNPFLIITKLK